MGTRLAILEVDEQKLEEIFARLDKAKNEIYACYDELSNLGVIRFTKKENDSNQKERGEQDGKGARRKT